MILARIAVLIAGVLLADGTPPDPSAGPIRQLRWLSGCWEQREARSTVQEFWTTPDGGMLFGVGRTIARREKGDSTVSYEVMRIYERRGRIIFAAHPSGQEPTEFTEQELTDSTVVFANPTHDFPQFIRYRRRGSNELHARVDGKMDGQDRGFDSRYRKVECP